MLKRCRWAVVPGILAGAVALAATGCGNGAEHSGRAGGPVTISLESYMPALGAPATQTLHGLVAGFEKANPSIRVKVTDDTKSDAKDLIAAYQREAATRSLPDVGQIVFDSLNFAVDSLGAQSLDDAVGADAVQDLFTGQHPYADAVRKLAVVNSHTYGIPWTLSTPVLFYNPTLFKRAGLDPDRPPSTWSEVAHAAAAIKARTGAAGLNTGCFGEASGGSDWCLQAMLGSAGGGVLSDDGQSTTFSNPANTTVIDTMRPMAADGRLVDATIPQSVAQFAAGRLGMVLNSSALQSTLLSAIGSKFPLRNGPMPGFAGRTATPTNSGSALMVFTTDAAKQRAAWKLIQWLTNERSETTITKQVGYPPLRPSLVRSAQYLKPYADQRPLIAANMAQLQRIRPWRAYPGSNFLQIEILLIDTVSKLVFQGGDPGHELTKAQSQANGLVG